MVHLNRSRNFWVIAILFLALVMVAQSCYYDNEEELYPFDAAQCDTVATVTYTNTIMAITNSNCAVSGCHTGVSPTGGLFLDTYQQVREIALNGDMSSRVLVSEDMPPSGPLSRCDMEAIQNWINNGAPE
ncbi:MAG: hypothetical protein LC664_07095 [Flavobacteriales bacterium]|nr:hypothetical protein [Flavobacteriales bacterium]